MAELIQADWEKVGVKTKLDHLRVGRVPEAQQDRRAARDDVRLVGRQRRPGQLLRAAARLRRGQGRRQRRALVQQGLREPGADGQAGDAPGRPRRLLRAGAGHRQRRGAVDHDRPLGALRPGAQGSDRLQDGRHRAPLTSTRWTWPTSKPPELRPLRVHLRPQAPRPRRPDLPRHHAARLRPDPPDPGRSGRGAVGRARHDRRSATSG